MKRIYMIAACGTGMSALAGLLKQKGFDLAGSDLANFPPVRDLLEYLKIPVQLSYDVEHLKAFDPDYVVIGNFVRRDNPQAQYVLDQKIPYGSMASTLEDFFLRETKQNLVVVGTHGKTTTASCLTHLLRSAGRNPGFFVGGISKNLSRNFEAGGGDYFVLEGDEYDTAFFDKKSKFLHYRPTAAIWTSLEFDHADIFDSMEKIEAMFQEFVELIPASAPFFYCADYPRIRDFIDRRRFAGAASYGLRDGADHPIEILQEGTDGMTFCVDGDRYHAKMTGAYNAQNFAACVLLAKALGLSVEDIQAGLMSFEGIKRRQEVRAQVGRHIVIDDFAHHPTAVKQALAGLRKRFPDKKLVVSFEPRSNTSRRNIFQKEFEQAFIEADALLLPEVFKKSDLEDPLDIAAIVRSANERGQTASGPLQNEDLRGELLEVAKASPEGCVFALLSNGSFNGLHEALISELKKV